MKLWIGPRLMVFLTNPKDVEVTYNILVFFFNTHSVYTIVNVEQVILSSNVYLDKSPEYRLFEPWLGNGLLISSGK